MNKNQIEQEWGKLKFELFENKPQIDGPYPPDVVKRRGFLIYAQVHLNNILDAKMKNDKWDEDFETEMYHRVMDLYYNWN